MQTFHEIEAEVFARLPERFHITENHETRLGRIRYSFLEGPAFARDGTLYCTDLPYGRIFRIAPNGGFDLVCQYKGRPNGLAIHRDGRIFVADQVEGILVLDPHSGKIEPLLSMVFGERLKAPNDLIFSRDGTLFFTDQGQSGLQNPNGCLYALRPDNTVDCILNNVPSPNGLVLGPDEENLFLAVTRANAVWRVPLNLFGNHAASRVGLYIQLSGGIGPDGMAAGADGSLAVAHVGSGTIKVFDKLGELLCRVRCPDIYPTNVAFGGPDLQDLYITESASGQILRARLPVTGQRLFSHS